MILYKQKIELLGVEMIFFAIETESIEFDGHVGRESDPSDIFFWINHKTRHALIKWKWAAMILSNFSWHAIKNLLLD